MRSRGEPQLTKTFTMVIALQLMTLLTFLFRHFKEKKFYTVMPNMYKRKETYKITLFE